MKTYILLIKHDAMKIFGGSGVIALLTLNIGTRWKRMVSFTPRPPYSQGKRACYPLDKRLCGPQRWSGRGGEEEKYLSLPMPGIEI